MVVAPAIWLSGDTDARRWLLALGGPIAYALLASLAVALVLVPLGTIYLRRRRDAGTDRLGGLSPGHQAVEDLDVPLVGGEDIEIMRSTVVLPAPLGPSTP